MAALVRSSFLVNAVYAESGREYGVTPQQGQLLCVLMSRSYGMSELGAMLRLAKSSLTGLVDRTERNGLVRRESCSPACWAGSFSTMRPHWSSRSRMRRRPRPEPKPFP